MAIRVAHVTPLLQSVHTAVRLCTLSTRILNVVVVVGATVAATSYLLN